MQESEKADIIASINILPTHWLKATVLSSMIHANVSTQKPMSQGIDETRVPSKHTRRREQLYPSVSVSLSQLLANGGSWKTERMTKG